MDYSQRHAVDLLVSDLLGHSPTQADTEVTYPTKANVAKTTNAAKTAKTAKIAEITKTAEITVPSETSESQSNTTMAYLEPL